MPSHYGHKGGAKKKKMAKKTGLTASQRKLPPKLQKAIMAKKKK